jgi:ribosomal protein L29
VSKLSEARRHIQAMTMAEAQAELKTLRQQLFHLRLQLARGEVKNNRQFPQVKADIARLMFHMSELNRGAREGDGELEEEAGADAEELAEPATPPVPPAASQAQAQTANTDTDTDQSTPD